MSDTHIGFLNDEIKRISDENEALRAEVESLKEKLPGALRAKLDELTEIAELFLTIDCSCAQLSDQGSICKHCRLREVFIKMEVR